MYPRTLGVLLKKKKKTMNVTSYSNTIVPLLILPNNGCNRNLIEFTCFYLKESGYFRFLVLPENVLQIIINLCYYRQNKKKFFIL